MQESKTRKNVDEDFTVAAVQRLQSGGVSANDLAKELGVSIWSLRKWSRQYRKKAAAGAGAAREPAAAPKELPAKPSRVFLTKTAKSQFVSKNSDLSPAPRRPYRGLPPID